MAEMKISNTLVNDSESQTIAYAEQILDKDLGVKQSVINAKVGNLESNNIVLNLNGRDDIMYYGDSDEVDSENPTSYFLSKDYTFHLYLNSDIDKSNLGNIQFIIYNNQLFLAAIADINETYATYYLDTIVNNQFLTNTLNLNTVKILHTSQDIIEQSDNTFTLQEVITRLANGSNAGYLWKDFDFDNEDAKYKTCFIIIHDVTKCVYTVLPTAYDEDTNTVTLQGTKYQFGSSDADSNDNSNNFKIIKSGSYVEIINAPGILSGRADYSQITPSNNIGDEVDLLAGTEDDYQVDYSSQDDFQSIKTGDIVYIYSNTDFKGDTAGGSHVIVRALSDIELDGTTCRLKVKLMTKVIIDKYFENTSSEASDDEIAALIAEVFVGNTEEASLSY